MSVNFIKAAELGITRCFDFQGRSSRSEFWWFHLFFFLLGGSIVIISGQFGASLDTIDGIINIYILILTIPSLSMMIRRLHDTGNSGWFVIVNFIPVIGLFFLIYIGTKLGDIEENHYGPPYRIIPKYMTLPNLIPCPKCNSENKSDASFCGGCGKPLGDIICTNCQFENSNTASFCQRCGQQLGAS